MSEVLIAATIPEMIRRTELKINLVLPALLFFSLYSCHSSQVKTPAPPASVQRDFSKVKTGMNFADVLKLVGAPDEEVDRGTVLDKYGNQTRTTEWHYGDYTVITIVNDTVNTIILDTRNVDARIQHIIDSARMAGDSAPMVQPSN